ncbi:MAG TPA: hypothetical protein VID70_04350 [Solirubrobacteraceae bacterium]
MDSGGRERTRLDFYREFRAQEGLSSVAVRRDREQGLWFLDVGVTTPVNVPSQYHGLEVRSKQTFGAINAVALPDQPD